MAILEPVAYVKIGQVKLMFTHAYTHSHKHLLFRVPARRHEAGAAIQNPEPINESVVSEFEFGRQLYDPCFKTVNKSGRKNAKTPKPE